MFKSVVACIALVFAPLSLSALPPQDGSPEENATDIRTPAELFDERIMPIFRSPDPSSCVQCHLSSVDLKNYILPSHEDTFVSLRDQGLIDLDDPADSKILKLIQMGHQDRDQAARLIHDDMRKAEFEAFASWITASCSDRRLRNLPSVDKTMLAQPPAPDAVIRHARKSRVVDSFVRNIWSQRLRCFPCHTPSEIKPGQKGALAKFNKWHEKYGDRMIIFKKTPRETLQHLITKSSQVPDGELPLINLQDPRQSLLILKPTAKIPRKVDGQMAPPSYSDPVSHMGGLKIHVDDQSYKSFMAWIEDYSRVVGEKYQSVDQLPADNWFATRRVLRLRHAPPDWKVGTPVQLFVHARGEDGWSQTAVAFTQGTVTPRKIVNGALFLLAPTSAAERVPWKQNGNRLPPGKYLVKIYVDQKGRIANDPTRLLTDEDYWGQVVIEDAKWQVGFPKAEWISGKHIADR